MFTPPDTINRYKNIQPASLWLNRILILVLLVYLVSRSIYFLRFVPSNIQQLLHLFGLAH